MAKKRVSKKKQVRSAPARSPPYVAYVLIGIAIIAGIFYFSNKGDEAPQAIKIPAQMGDNVLFLFKATLENGTLLDTNLEDAAKAFGVYDPSRSYDAENITLGKGQVMLPIEQGLVGMSVDEKKKITILPEQAFGVYDPNNSRWLSRVVENERTVKIRRYIQVPSDEFHASYGKGDLVGLVINSSETGVKYAFLSEEEGQVTFEIIAELNSNVSVPGTVWPSSVYIKDAQYIYALQEVHKGDIYSTPTGIISILDVTADSFTTQLVVQPGDTIRSSSLSGVVQEVNETHMKIDANHPYAGQSVIVELMRIG